MNRSEKFFVAACIAMLLLGLALMTIGLVWAAQLPGGIQLNKSWG